MSRLVDAICGFAIILVFTVKGICIWILDRASRLKN
jgi:hypothetical protein